MDLRERKMKVKGKDRQASNIVRQFSLGIERQSGNDVVNDLTVHVGEAVVATRVTVG